MTYPFQASLPASLIVGGKKNSLFWEWRIKTVFLWEWRITDPRLLRMLHHRENLSSWAEAGNSQYCPTSKAWFPCGVPFHTRGVQPTEIAHPCVQPGVLSWADIAMLHSGIPTEEEDVFSLPCTLQKRWLSLLNSSRFFTRSFAGSSLIIFRISMWSCKTSIFFYLCMCLTLSSWVLLLRPGYCHDHPTFRQPAVPISASHFRKAWRWP